MPMDRKNKYNEDAISFKVDLQVYWNLNKVFNKNISEYLCIDFNVQVGKQKNNIGQHTSEEQQTCRNHLKQIF